MRILSYDAAITGDEETLDELVARGVNFDEPHWPGGRAVLHALASGGDRKPVELLLARGANTEVRDRSGYTPLHVAAKEGHKDVVEALLGRSANLSAPCNTGDTPLHLAAEFGREDVVKVLLQRGASVDLEKRGSDGDTPLHSASYFGNPSILEAILEHAAQACNSRVLNMGNDEGRTPLHYAGGKGNVDVVNVLIRYGADLDARDVYGATPFHFAARIGNTDAMSVLLVDICKKSFDGFTALHYAAWNGRKEAVEWLLRRQGGVVGEQDNKGNTALHWAARTGRCDVIEALVRGGARVSVRNKKGKLPSELVEEYHAGTEAREKALRALFSVQQAQNRHRALVLAPVSLVLSIVFALAAFLSAGFALVPLIFMGTLIVVGLVCLLMLAWFLGQLYPRRPRWWRNVEVTMCSGVFVCLLMVAWFIDQLYQLRPGWWRNVEDFIFRAYLRSRQWKSLIGDCLYVLAQRHSYGNEDDDHYKVGSRYKYVPWDDGLNWPQIQAT